MVTLPMTLSDPEASKSPYTLSVAFRVVVTGGDKNSLSVVNKARRRSSFVDCTCDGRRPSMPYTHRARVLKQPTLVGLQYVDNTRLRRWTWPCAVNTRVFRSAILRLCYALTLLIPVVIFLFVFCTIVTSVKHCQSRIYSSEFVQ